MLDRMYAPNGLLDFWMTPPPPHAVEDAMTEALPAAIPAATLVVFREAQAGGAP